MENENECSCLRKKAHNRRPLTGMADTVHSNTPAPPTRTVIPERRGVLVCDSSLDGEASQACIFKTMVFWGKLRKLVLSLLHQRADRSLAGVKGLAHVNASGKAENQRPLLSAFYFVFSLKRFVWKNFTCLK